MLEFAYLDFTVGTSFAVSGMEEMTWVNMISSW